MVDQGCGLEASPSWVRGQFLVGNRAENLKGKHGTIMKRFILLIKFLTVSDTNNLIVNFEFT
jgi:hypothetical protein